MSGETTGNAAQAVLDDGLRAFGEGRPVEAAGAFAKAAALTPEIAAPHLNLGVALKALGRLGEALDAFDRALEIDCDWAEAHYNRANVLNALGRSGDAEAALRRAIGLKPDFAGAWNNLGLLLAAGGRFDEAVAAYRQALTGDLEKPEILNNLGNALQALDRLAEAEEVLRRALDLAPGDGRLHLNLGGVLQDQGALDAAAAAYGRAVSLCPEDVDARLRLAMLTLLTGDLKAGFDAYEWRWRDSGFIEGERHRRAPGWTGEDLKGKRLLLWAEQGFGDAIQFARFAALTAARGAEVVVECPKPLVRLFETLTCVAAVTEPGLDDGDFDFQAPLMSLPLTLGVTLETIPAAPYLFSEVQAGRREKLPAVDLDGGLNVGLVWAGGKSHKNDRKRSLDPALLEPLTSLTGLPGVNFFSLQAAAKETPPGVASLAPVADFAETAALISGLDLVISVDTAVAHLAGALGRPVWIMLPFAPDWRWLRGRDDSPWYPTARLFRQRSPGDWPGVVEALGRALARFA
ncbi:MAG TPA: glycosyltransferase family 41 protein [Alphaproteobacteria bacterium]|nr:glycosyltransferase family 41 protein [Alphaproteobacteria bacterium]